jgi:hypothetical protein
MVAIFGIISHFRASPLVVTLIVAVATVHYSRHFYISGGLPAPTLLLYLNG